MSGTDSLRSDLLEIAGRGPIGTQIVDALIAYVAANPRAVLEATGHEVREGWMVNVTARRVFEEKFPAATIDFETPQPRYVDEYQPVLVVRLRGELDA